MTVAYPLTWPESIPRWTRARDKGVFKTQLAGAIENVQGELRRFGNDSGKPVREIVISSNVTLGVHAPSDPGVAVWFTWEDHQVCIPVDRYSTVAANLQAIFCVLEARRTELRHGTLALVRASMQGLLALPPPPHWSEIIGCPKTATKDEMEAVFKVAARRLHPDTPGTGSKEGMVALNAARSRALKEFEA